MIFFRWNLTPFFFEHFSVMFKKLLKVTKIKSVRTCKFVVFICFQCAFLIDFENNNVILLLIKPKKMSVEIVCKTI